MEYWQTSIIKSDNLIEAEKYIDRCKSHKNFHDSKVGFNMDDFSKNKFSVRIEYMEHGEIYFHVKQFDLNITL